jgi:ferredoxin-NADP reductase
VEDDGYDSIGHVDVELSRELVPGLRNADYYICVTAAFMADMEDGLQKLGAPPAQIQNEIF